MENLNDLMDLIDNSVINKTQNSEQFQESIKTIINYLNLKGPIDNKTKNYLDMLFLCSDEIVSLKKKGVKVSTRMFASSEPIKEDNIIETVKEDIMIEETDNSNHYSYGCDSTGKSFHYSAGC